MAARVRFDKLEWKRIEFLMNSELFQKFKEMKNRYGIKNTSKLLRYCVGYTYKFDKEDE